MKFIRLPGSRSRNTEHKGEAKLSSCCAQPVIFPQTKPILVFDGSLWTYLQIGGQKVQKGHWLGWDSAYLASHWKQKYLPEEKAVGGPDIQDHLWPHHGFEARLGYVRP